MSDQREGWYEEDEQEETHNHRKTLGDDARPLRHGRLEQLVEVAGDAVRRRQAFKCVLDDRHLLAQLSDQPVVVVELGRGEEPEEDLSGEEVRVWRTKAKGVLYG